MKAAIAALAVIAVLAAATAATAHYATAANGDPPRFATVLHTLRTDALKIAGDLRREQGDARAGSAGRGEPACYNLFNNVDYSAVRAIAHFVANTVVNDQIDLQTDINQLRANIVTFNSDIASFVNDGVPSPVGAAWAVKQISAAIQRTKNAANIEIRTMNVAVQAAYSLADKLVAQGGCPASDRPENQFAMPVIPSVT